MIATFLLRYARTVSLAAALLAVSGFGSTVMAQSVAAMVNGEAITNFDVDQRIKLTQLTARKVISRQEALEELINDKLKVKEAKRYGL
ncbi:MAG TPA: peptidylprolyl isomerase, partial [Afipia sp.]